MMKFRQVVADSNPMPPSSSSRRSPRSESEQRALVSAWQASGLSQQAFCRHHQLHRKTLSRWCKKFAVAPIQSDREATSLVLCFPNGMCWATINFASRIAVTNGRS